MINRLTVLKCRPGTEMLPVMLEALVLYSFYGEHLLFFNAGIKKILGLILFKVEWQCLLCKTKKGSDDHNTLTLWNDSVKQRPAHHSVCNESHDECDIQWIRTLYRIPQTAQQASNPHANWTWIKHLFTCMIWFIILRLEDEILFIRIAEDLTSRWLVSLSQYFSFEARVKLLKGQTGVRLVILVDYPLPQTTSFSMSLSAAHSCFY